MFFLPYRAQIKLQKFPTVTVLVMLICFFIYLAQHQRDNAIADHAQRVCQELAAKSENGYEGAGFTIEPDWLGSTKRTYTCPQVMLWIYYTSNPDGVLAWWKKYLRHFKLNDEADRLERQYKAFVAGAPRPLAEKLWHERSRVDFVGMLTSSFAHGSWSHLIFNLIFFFVFAAAVEMVVGPVLFSILVILLAYGIGIMDHAISLWRGDLRPSLGLSGVVFGMLGLFAYLLPKAKIRFFYWFILSVGTIGLPGWMVIVWYMGWDLLSVFQNQYHVVNYIAHIAGGALGVLFGILFFHKKRHWSRDLVLKDVDLTKDVPVLVKVNEIMMAPLLLGFGFLALMFVMIFMIILVKSFWLQLMLVSPIVAAGGFLYWQKRKPDDYALYRRGVAAMENRSFEEAVKILKPLADRNYTRALQALGKLHLTAHGALKDPSKAVGYLSRSADRGDAEAQYLLGTLYVDGRGVPPNTAKALEYFEKAAQNGVPEAAMGMAHIFENGVGMSIDLPKAIEWYGRAGEMFQKAGRREDAVTIIRLLDGLAPRNPEAQIWVNRLKAR